jgi:AcrR family transcriptional regulator
MADVARELELSTGSLYTYVSSKEALFHLVVIGADAAIQSGSLPMPSPGADETVAAVRERLARAFQLPSLRAARRSSHADDPAGELADVIGELYDAMEENRSLLAVVERSAFELPGLAAQYYRRNRRGHVERFADYLQRRIDSDAFRAVPDVSVTGRYLLEALTWFAWHRHDDPDSAMIDDASARATVIDMAVAALVRPEHAALPRRGRERTT